MYPFLKKVPLFSGLADEDLNRLCEMVTEVLLPAGEALFSEGSPGDQAYVIKEGEIEITKKADGREILLAVLGAGEVIGEMSLLESAPRSASGRARTNCILLAIRYENLDQLLSTSPAAARSILGTMVARLRSSELVLRQNEKLAQLSTLTAGIAHELNNPAAAVQRGADQLQAALAQLQHAHRQLSLSELTPLQVENLASLIQLAREKVTSPEELDALTRSDRQWEIENWLEEHGVVDGWELAPALVNLGLQAASLQNSTPGLTPQQLTAAFTWLNAASLIFSLLREISQGSGKINAIVKALKTYVYLDKAPAQMIDLEESIELSLASFHDRLVNIQVSKEFTSHLPPVEASSAELEQVWFNLITNAIDALQGRGEIHLRTRLEEAWVVVDVEDDGPGIPQKIQSKIFDPFFSTKPIGKGAGLGLNIAENIIRKHGGEIKLFSQPRKTTFQVRLPVNIQDAKSGATPLSVVPDISENKIRQILENYHAVGVVGISKDPNTPAHSVPAYLQRHGYKIYPVNPNLAEILGEKAYPDLKSIPAPIEIVLIFRRSEFIHEIVEQAVQIGARVVWMQEGIVNETAAEAARSAGLEVVMDTCMRIAHKRLFSREKSAP